MMRAQGICAREPSGRYLVLLGPLPLLVPPQRPRLIHPRPRQGREGLGVVRPLPKACVASGAGDSLGGRPSGVFRSSAGAFE